MVDIAMKKYFSFFCSYFSLCYQQSMYSIGITLLASTYFLHEKLSIFALNIKGVILTTSTVTGFGAQLHRKACKISDQILFLILPFDTTSTSI